MFDYFPDPFPYIDCWLDVCSSFLPTMLAHPIREKFKTMLAKIIVENVDQNLRSVF